MKVYHILDHFFPINTGYTFRSKYIIKTQKFLGCDPEIIVSPKGNKGFPKNEIIDGIQCFRSHINSRSFLAQIPLLKELYVMKCLEREIIKQMKNGQCDLIHAHSPLLCGWPAYRAAKKFGVPVVYEVRALWEDAAVDQNKINKKSIRYALTKNSETALFNKVDAVITICEGLKNEICARGINPKKIFVIPNGVDVDIFVPLEKDRDLLECMKLNGKFVLGFIGSFFKFEGLSKIIKAISEIRNQAKNIKLILVGKGEDEQNLKVLVDDLKLNDYVVFTGQIPHDRVLNYYSIMDVLIYPRESSKLTETVTPLKPLEAMSMGKAVIGSDVGGLEELICDEETGLLFKNESVSALSEKIIDLFNNRKKIEALGKNARQYAIKERNWLAIIKRNLDIYNYLIQKKL